MRKRNLLFVACLLIIISLIIYFILGEEMKTTQNWKGIIPGSSNRSDVISILGEPYKSKNLSEGEEILYYYIELSSEFLEENPIFVNYPTFNEIYLNSDIVYLIIENIWAKNKSEGVFLTPEQIFDQYGKPKNLAWVKDSQIDRAFLYCKQGTIFICDINNVGTIMYFEPMSNAKCLKEFSNIISKDPPNIPDVIFPPLDLWGILD